MGLKKQGGGAGNESVRFRWFCNDLYEISSWKLASNIRRSSRQLCKSKSDVCSPREVQTGVAHDGLPWETWGSRCQSRRVLLRKWQVTAIGMMWTYFSGQFKRPLHCGCYGYRLRRGRVPGVPGGRSGLAHQIFKRIDSGASCSSSSSRHNLRGYSWR